MVKSMFKRDLVVIIIVLFIFMSATPSSGIKISDKPVVKYTYGTTLNVGGSGPNNYTKIQDAIDDASEGDTVFVYNGTYYESIFIDKPLQVIGENRQNTIIDGKGHEIVVTIFSNDVLFKDFTVQNPILGLKIGLYVEWGFIRIYSNIIRGSRIGIQISSDCSRIIGNNITKNIVGLILDVPFVNIVEENNFIKNVIHATFFVSFFNFWNHNYWDRGVVKNCKVIFGTFGYRFYTPWIQLDRNPARGPYDI